MEKPREQTEVLKDLQQPPTESPRPEPSQAEPDEASIVRGGLTSRKAGGKQEDY